MTKKIIKNYIVRYPSEVVIDSSKYVTVIFSPIENGQVFF